MHSTAGIAEAGKADKAAWSECACPAMCEAAGLCKLAEQWPSSAALPLLTSPNRPVSPLPTPLLTSLTRPAPLSLPPPSSPLPARAQVRFLAVLAKVPAWRAQRAQRALRLIAGSVLHPYRHRLHRPHRLQGQGQQQRQPRAQV